MDCLFNSSFSISTKETSNLYIIGPLWVESTGDWRFFLHKGPIMQKALPWCFDIRVDSWFAASEWETALLCNNVTHWPGESLESALWHHPGVHVGPGYISSQGISISLPGSGIQWDKDLAPHNSLAPGRCGCNLESVIFKLMWRIDVLSISCEIFLRCLVNATNLTDD